MALPSSGPISLGNMKTEFGGNASPKLSDYYRGGGFNIDPNEKVPTSGTIKFSDLYGTSQSHIVTNSEVVLAYTANKRNTTETQKLIINGTEIKTMPLDFQTYYGISEYITITNKANLPIVQIDDMTFTPGTTGMYTVKDGTKSAIGIGIDKSGFMRLYKFTDYSTTTPNTDPSNGQKYGIFDKNVTIVYKDSSNRTATKVIVIRMIYYS